MPLSSSSSPPRRMWPSAERQRRHQHQAGADGGDGVRPHAGPDQPRHQRIDRGVERLLQRTQQLHVVSVSRRACPRPVPRPAAGAKDNRQNWLGQSERRRRWRARLFGIRAAPAFATARRNCVGAAGAQPRDDRRRRSVAGLDLLAQRRAAGQPVEMRGESRRSASAWTARTAASRWTAVAVGIVRARGRSPASRIPASAVSAYFPSPGRLGVNATPVNRTPGELRARAPRPSTAAVSSHGAPICSNGASEPAARRSGWCPRTGRARDSGTGSRAIGDSGSAGRTAARSRRSGIGAPPARHRHDARVGRRARGPSRARRASSPRVMP